MDFHAEATSEKIAMGWHLDGKATLVVGTHTHVQTADERILPNGTAYLTDAGMTGPHDSIIGMEREPALARFSNGMPSKFEPATGNPRLNGIVVDADEATGRATARDAHQLRRARSGRDRRHGMSSLFDLPFEDAGRRRAAGAGAAGAAGAPRLHGVGADRADSRTTLEERFFEVWVEGELSNCKRVEHRPLYFTLKDARAQVKGVMFRSALRMTALHAQGRPARGGARAGSRVYDPKGEYQIVCEHLEPAGLGARQLAFEQLKTRLAAEGLFAAVRKRPLPELPRKVGVVTSLDGAAVRDIIQVLRRRYANVHIVIRPTRVQGDGAALEIARAIQAIGQRPQGGRRHRRPRRRLDRGPVGVQRGSGGARHRRVPGADDLGGRPRDRRDDCRLRRRLPRGRRPRPPRRWCSRARTTSTPRVDRLARRLDRAVESRADRLEARLRAIENRPALAGFHARLAMRQRHASELQTAFDGALRRRVAAERRRVTTHPRPPRRAGRAPAAVVGAPPARRAARRHRRSRARPAPPRRRRAWASSAGRLEALSPLSVLARGYAVCWNDDRSTVVRRASQVAAGDRVRVRLVRGRAAVRRAGDRWIATPARLRVEPASKSCLRRGSASLGQCLIARVPRGHRRLDEDHVTQDRESEAVKTSGDATIKDFETAIAELERIVKQLEDGDLPLESSLQLYERGVQLSRYCHGRLEEAERRIEILNERGQLRPAGADLDAPGETRER